MHIWRVHFSQHVEWPRHKTRVHDDTSSWWRSIVDDSGGCPLCHGRETGGRVLSRVLDLCETAVAAEPQNTVASSTVKQPQQSAINNQQTWSKW